MIARGLRRTAYPGRALAERPTFGASYCLPPLVLVAGALAMWPVVPAWGFMWAIAAALFASGKWVTWRRAADSKRFPTRARSMGYLLAWPGMNPVAFAHAADQSVRTAMRGSRDVVSVSHAVLRMVTGAILVWFVSSQLSADRPSLAAWAGMVGFILLVHFGIFDLVAAAWQFVGVAVAPVMQAPARSTSVAELWGGGWNTAFRDLAQLLVYRPLVRRTTPAAAGFVVFAVSGLIHELLISVPARGGYGLLTAYFLIQWLAIVAERSAAGRKLGLRRGRRGWLFTALVALGPLYWLFHPAFVRNVATPFLQTIGALQPATANGVFIMFGEIEKLVQANVENLIRTAGAIHLAILVAAFAVPRVLRWNDELNALGDFLRRLFWVYGGFIAYTILGFGLLSLLNAPALAAGSPLARGLCVFIAVFWFSRLLVQVFVFSTKPFAGRKVLLTGYHLLTSAFVLLSGIYGFAAVR